MSSLDGIADGPDGFFQVLWQIVWRTARTARTKPGPNLKTSVRIVRRLKSGNLPPAKELVAIYYEHATSRKCAGGRYSSNSRTLAPSAQLLTAKPL
jgi:hypothetical protein